MVVTKMGEDPLILEYKTNPTPELLEEIVVAYQPWIKKAISNINPAFPVSDRDDLLQCAMIGFMAALERFDPDRGVPFKSWANFRVRGAALDMVKQVSVTSRGHEDRKVLTLDDSMAWSEDLADDGFEDSLFRMDESVSLILQEAIMNLPLRQGLSLLLSIHGMKPISVARIMEVTPTTVHVLKSAAMKTLRDTLSDQLKELA